MQVARYGQAVRFGAVFDMNGVIINDGPLHDRAWLEVGKRHGVPPAATVSYLEQVAGQSTAALARGLFPELTRNDAAIREIGAEKKRIYWELLSLGLKNNLQELIIPGVREFTRRLNDESISLALNTSSPAIEVEEILSAFGIIDHFGIILTEEDVVNHKPHPEGYQLAARQLGIDPKYCVGFEDSIPGLISLRAAGYGAKVAVGTILTESQILGQCPWTKMMYISNFNGLTLNQISSLLTFGHV
jgi:HAD superfamily hydrolase (TIGR01509 family)